MPFSVMEKSLIEMLLNKYSLVNKTTGSFPAIYLIYLIAFLAPGYANTGRKSNMGKNAASAALASIPALKDRVLRPDKSL
jgi:hypothetical protein